MPTFLPQWQQFFNQRLRPEWFQQWLGYYQEVAGKQLRPNLLLAMGQALGTVPTSTLQPWALALELHHTYTLIHDDLPSMDNDSERRSIPTLHRQIGEAQALLVGDALLHWSLELGALEGGKGLSSELHRQMLKLFFWATGRSGLILGQSIDLRGSQPEAIPLGQQSILRMFELKTARLFQLAFLLPLVAENRRTLTEQKTYARLGSWYGTLFQLVDDWDDYCTKKPAGSFNLFDQLGIADQQALLRTYHQRGKYFEQFLSAQGLAIIWEQWCRPLQQKLNAMMMQSGQV